ncbi:MAG TPA: DUF4040 domain-containing protein [Solirubrobacteraceae bacterium]|nr:DUF4040 domain-containing protein [Solirubrobacteraceae bacterium]
MTALQVSALVIVTLCGTAIVLTPSPLRQTLLMAIFGFALTALFFAFQAPDVALSELVVSGIALPLIVLSALRRLADQKRHASGQDTTDPAGSDEPGASSPGGERSER